ncbi:MAG: hypothetical protein GX082_02495 [Clostridiaceae bacterium]|nr:hypothetical protein [Clostridiaceae bacterium]
MFNKTKTNILKKGCIWALKAIVVFADIERYTLCIDPKDISHRISKDTKAIVTVYYNIYPAPMDEIL